MTNSTRRSLLRYGAASGAAFLAGCLGDDPAATPGDADDGCNAEDVLTEGRRAIAPGKRIPGRFGGG